LPVSADAICFLECGKVPLLQDRWENFLSKAHILVADPNALVCEALRRLIELEVEVLGIVCDDSSLFRLVQTLKPEGVLLSIYRPFVHGLATGSKLKSTFPHLKIIVVTPNDDVEAATESLNQWASGYLHMKSTSPELIKALRDSMHGVKYLTPVLRNSFEGISFKDQGFRSSHQLTSRERDVLRLLSCGCTMKEAGATLGISARTVAFHKYRIMTKLGATSNVRLLKLAMDQGIV
jgi:DNA-binding NarL/FixJ family response regulator